MGRTATTWLRTMWTPEQLGILEQRQLRMAHRFHTVVLADALGVRAARPAATAPEEAAGPALPATPAFRHRQGCTARRCQRASSHAWEQGRLACSAPSFSTPVL